MTQTNAAKILAKEIVDWIADNQDGYATTIEWEPKIQAALDAAYLAGVANGIVNYGKHKDAEISAQATS